MVRGFLSAGERVTVDLPRGIEELLVRHAFQRRIATSNLLILLDPLSLHITVPWAMRLTSAFDLHTDLNPDFVAFLACVLAFFVYWLLAYTIGSLSKTLATW
jgi:hypothetical protein